MTTPRFEKIIPTPPPKHEPVRDNLTGLIWSVEFSPTRLTFEQAEKYIATLNAQNYQGFDDWRLPTRVELLTLIDDTLHNPAIDTDAFPDTPSEWFWTCTPYASNRDAYAWLVYFNYGHSGYSGRGGCGRVRAVRGTMR